jgi:hypothetical protein
MKTLRQEILQFLRNNQNKEFKVENIRDEMWKIFEAGSMNAYAYFVSAVQHEMDDLVKKKKIKKMGDMYSIVGNS